MDTNFVKVLKTKIVLRSMMIIFFFVGFVLMIIGLLEMFWASIGLAAMLLVSGVVLCFLAGVLIVLGMPQFLGSMPIGGEEVLMSYKDAKLSFSVNGVENGISCIDRTKLPVAWMPDTYTRPKVNYGCCHLMSGLMLHLVWGDIKNYALYVEDVIVMKDGHILTDNLAMALNGVPQSGKRKTSVNYHATGDFVYEKEEHKTAKVVAKIMSAYSWINLLICIILSINTGYYMYLVPGFGNMLIMDIIINIIKKSFVPFCRGGLTLGAKQVHAYIRFPKEISLTVAGRQIRCEQRKYEEIPISIPDFAFDGIFYASYRFEDGKVLHFLVPGEQKYAMFIDNVMIMEDGKIYQNAIDDIFGVVEVPVQQAVSKPVHMPGNIYNTKTEQPMCLARYTLKAIAGVKAGQSWKLDTPLRIGRNQEACQIVFEQNTQGVSRTHCEVGVRNGKAYIKDFGATYGTMLSNGTMVKDYAEYELTENMTFTMGTKESFMVVRD